MDGKKTTGGRETMNGKMTGRTNGKKNKMTGADKTRTTGKTQRRNRTIGTRGKPPDGTFPPPKRERKRGKREERKKEKKAKGTKTGTESITGEKIRKQTKEGKTKGREKTAKQPELAHC